MASLGAGSEAVQGALDRFEALEVLHALGPGAQLTDGLWAAQQKFRKDRLFFRIEPQESIQVMTVLRGADSFC